MIEQAIYGYVQQQIANADAWIEGWTKDVNGKALPSRFMMVKMRQYSADYMTGKNTRRWVIIPGLRGVGKSTLLAQYYKHVQDTYGTDVNLLRISLHDVVNVMGGTLKQAIEQYELIIGGSLERLEKPTFLFLDEVQEDENWGKILFSLHERTRKLFIVCSGSSAIYLKKDANMVRRAHFEPLYPLNYCEYQMLRFNVMPEVGLKNSLKEAVFLSRDASQAHRRLIRLLPSIRAYQAKIDVSTFTHFMYTGSLPFLINETNPAQVYNDIISLIERIINEDLAKGYNFDSTSLNAVKPLLFMLADGDVISRSKLAAALSQYGIKDPRLVGQLLDALVRTELLIEVPSRGTVTIAVSKPKKYLFMSPAIRATFHQIAGLAATDETRKGRLLEDLVGLYMYREFTTRRLADFTYNAGEGHADFMLQTKAGARIAIEVGLGRKTSKQVANTMRDVKCDYGIVLSATSLRVDKTSNILFLPLSIFYMV
ncbi:ATP-binding protein [Candidatus Saccharibacteria bacterium]|nr:ATP-binding protein [Candidatus Saccharibacteria bacterium]